VTSTVRLLGVASLAVAFAAADTYVVVLALPDMMAGVGLAVDELQRAAPIVSGFLLGYVAMLPLIGRIADLRGRVPVLVASLVVFALGSLITAAAYDLTSMVVGRFLQGLGGGGLVPATLALVADLYPVQRRGVPLGVVGAVQELGSVLGPLYGALVLLVAPWQGIFWLNVAAALLLALLLLPGSRAAATAPAADRVGPRNRFDWPGAVLALLCLVSGTLVMLEPGPLVSDVTLGLGFVPVAGGSRWLSPVGLATVLLGVLLLTRCLLARHPLVDVRQWGRLFAGADLTGAALMAVGLGGIVLAFAGADPERSVLSPAAPWLLTLSAAAAVGFGWHLRRAERPLVPRASLAATAAWGSLVVSFLIGAALIAALVDVPIFARLTVAPDSQLEAALVLVRLLAALPVGALLGGYLSRRVPAGPITAVGMLLAAGGFAWMAQWGLHSLEHWSATVPLVAAGLGFGLAVAPVNAALLAATADAVHGVASAFLVVARMVGMLVGISALTAIGLRRYYAVQVDLPSPGDVCAQGTQCPAYTALLKEAGLAQLQAVFVGAAVCAVVAGLVALVVFRSAGTRGLSTAELLAHAA
jgi:MFS family permease